MGNKIYKAKLSKGSQSSMEFAPKPTTHYKARREKYAGDETVLRLQFKEKHVLWNVKYKDYKPVTYTLPFILEKNPEWADPDVMDNDAFKKIQFNKMDGKVNRSSFHGLYEVINGLPINPVGRTGLCGRGQLGKWGPNHAADPIVTRWKRNSDGVVINNESSNEPILEFVCVQRRDNLEWAIPGGMVDSGEHVSLTLKREFGEEALNTLEECGSEETKKNIEELFKHGDIVYKGYVDDPRNTDNAWVETIAVNFHDSDGTTVGKIPLSAGDDAQAVKWRSIDGSIQLYATHTEFLRTTCEKLGAYFGNS